MDLSKAKLGDQFRIFLTKEGDVSASPTMKTLLGTIISINKPAYGSDVIFGWKNDEPHPPGCYDRSGKGSPDNDYIPNHQEYKWGKKVSRKLLVAIQIFNGLDGFPCKKCTNFFPLSEPNQTDGTLVCWSCRHG